MNAQEMDQFKDWLTRQGAQIRLPSTQWEILRVATCGGLFIAYRNSKGVERWPEGLLVLIQHWRDGDQIALAPARENRKSLRHNIPEIVERDGLECWFCEIGFLHAKSVEITMEHLVSVSHGGPNHISNLVIACKPCNQAVANLSVSEKVRFREAKRRELP